MNSTPAWINRAADAIAYGFHEYDDNGNPKVEFAYQIADIISDHFPKPKEFEWVRQQTLDPAAFHERAKTALGEYDIFRSGMSEIYFMNGSSFNTIEAARAAAYADHCAKLKACYGDDVQNV